MAELSETLLVATQFTGGNFKLVIVTATVGSSSDTIILTEAQVGGDAILGIVGAVITGGMSANFANIQVSFSSMTLTVASFKSTFAAADTFSGTTVSIAVIVSTAGTE